MTDEQVIATLSRSIRKGLRPPCPFCQSMTLKVGKPQRASTGGRGIAFQCQTPNCKLKNGFVEIPWWDVILQSVQMRVVQLTLAGLAGLTLGGLAVAWGGWQHLPILSGDDSNRVVIYTKGQDAYPEIGRLITTAGPSDIITFAGMNFYITANERSEDISDAVRRGATVRFMIAPPTRPIAQEFSDRFGQDVDTILSQCEQGLRSLTRIDEALRSSSSTGPLRGSFEVRILKEVPTYRIYHKKMGATTSFFLVPYLQGVKSTLSPAFGIPPGSPASPPFDASIEVMWKRGINLQEWQKYPLGE